jgi:hypothetical protein
VTAKVDIFNLALTRIGQSKVATDTEQSAAGFACRDNYDVARRAVLAMHPWRFALKTATLALRDETPENYSYSYTLPSDNIQVIGVEPIHTTPPIEFEEFGEALYTDDGTGTVRYVWDITDVNKFDPLFVSALACHLAADIAPVLTGKLDQQQMMLQWFGVLLRSARGASAAAARQPSRTGQDLKTSRQ